MASDKYQRFRLENGRFVLFKRGFRNFEVCSIQFKQESSRLENCVEKFWLSVSLSILEDNFVGEELHETDDDVDEEDEAS